MTTFQAEHFGSAADIAMILVQLFENIVALVSVTSLMQSRKLASGCSAAAIAVHQWRQMLACDVNGTTGPP